MLNDFPFMYLICYETYSLSGKAIKKHRWLPQIEYIVFLFEGGREEEWRVFHEKVVKNWR